MTGTSVTNVGSYLARTAVERQEKNAKNDAVSLMGSFTQVLSDTTGRTASNNSQLKQTEAVKKPENNSNRQVQEKPDSSEAKTEKADEAEDALKAEDKNPVKDTDETKPADEETDGELKGAAEKVADAVLEQLGVTREELLKAMEQLGLGMEELLNPARVNDLVVALTGGEDALSLVTNAELYRQLRSILDVVSEVTDGLKEKLGVSDEQFAALLLQVKNASREQAAMPEQTVEDGGQTAERTVQTANGPVVELVNATEEGKDILSRQAQNPQSGQETAAPADEEETETMTQVKRTSEHAGRENSKDSQNAFAGGMTQQDMTPNTAAAGRMTAENPLPQMADTEEIMRQIAERIKIVVSPEVSEMEMQLKPESLGNLHLQIAVKNGAMTAQFTAESEAVKHVIETQMVQLKENLNGQGIRVEAVEVTVASHEFERNLQQGDGRNDGEQTPEKGRRSRSINLGEIGSLDEADLTEDDRIAAEMMLQNGSTVDYIA